MGSPDPDHARQLNGMGGGISSLSKICVVGEPTSPDAVAAGADVEYTFVQVGVRDTAVDYSGNCGNLSSMIGAFALYEGIPTGSISCHKDRVTVKAFNLNTNKLINNTFPATQSANDRLPEPQLELQETAIAGVHGKSSKIVLDFVAPGGAGTGKLLPTGMPVQRIETEYGQISASLVDATNPTVFIPYTELSDLLGLDATSPVDFKSPQVLSLLEAIRTQGGSLMELAPAQAQPKIAVLSPPNEAEKHAVDVFIHTLSMGELHKAVPMTVGLCLGVAAGIEDTLAWRIVRKSRANGPPPSHVRVKHPSGTVDVGADFDEEGVVISAQVVRTGRRIMKGVVWW